MTNEPPGILLQTNLIVFETNESRFCDGIFKSRWFFQACAVRNGDSRYEIEGAFFLLVAKLRLKKENKNEKLCVERRNAT